MYIVITLSICLCIHIFFHLHFSSFYLSIYLSAYLPLYLPINWSAYISLYRPPSIHLSISLYLSIAISLLPSFYFPFFFSSHLTLVLSIAPSLYFNLYLSLPFSLLSFSFVVFFVFNPPYLLEFFLSNRPFTFECEFCKLIFMVSPYKLNCPLSMSKCSNFAAIHYTATFFKFLLSSCMLSVEPLQQCCHFSTFGNLVFPSYLYYFAEVATVLIKLTCARSTYLMSVSGC